MKYDNPAGRLLEILSAAKTYSKNSEARLAWQAIFDLPSSNPDAAMAARYAKAMQLPQEALEALREDDPELTLKPPGWVNQATAAFMQHALHGNMNTFTEQYSDDTINNVRTVAALLNKGSNRKVLSSDELGTLRKLMDETLTSVLEGDVPDDIRIYLARALRKIIMNIDEYRLTGAAPIQEAIEQTVGHAFVDTKYRSFLTDTEVGQRVLDALSSASNMVTVAIGLPQLAFTTSLLLQNAQVA